MSREKIFTVVWHADYLRCPLPKGGDELLRLSGSGPFRDWHRWSRSRRRFNKKNTHLWYSVLQLKRVCEPPTDEILLEKFKDHRAAMAKEDGTAPTCVELVLQTLEPVLVDVAEKLGNILERPSVSPVADSALHPSTSACYEQSRENGGQLGALRVAMQLWVADGRLRHVRPQGGRLCGNEGRCWPCVAARGRSFWDEVFGTDFVVDDDLNFLAFRVRWTEEEKGEQERRYAIALENFLSNPEHWWCPFDGTERWAYSRNALRSDGTVGPDLQAVYDGSDVRLAWDVSVEDLKQFVREESPPGSAPLHCEVSGVLEPLKVRVITKGPAAWYYFAKRFQKALWESVKNSCGGQWARAIGRPVCATDVMDVVGDRNPDGGQGGFLSIDYAAATDELSASISAAILSRLLRDLPLDAADREALRLVLAPHVVEYPLVKVSAPSTILQKRWVGKGKQRRRVEVEVPNPKADEQVSVWLDPVVQKNGQLMGSPLSFPILCLANLATYLINTEGRGTLEERLGRVLVNGDDMLYWGTQIDYRTHTQVAAAIGLRESIGKAYWHPRFANINSTCFQLGDDGRTLVVPYLNLGLLAGQGKVMNGKSNKAWLREEHTKTDVVARIQPFLDGCLTDESRVRMLATYINKHKEAIQARAGWRNLFVDPSLGGMGLRAPPGWEVTYTEEQRVHALELRLRSPQTHWILGPGPTLPQAQPLSQDPQPFQGMAGREFRVPRMFRRRRSPEGVLPTDDHMQGRLITVLPGECAERVLQNGDAWTVERSWSFEDQTGGLRLWSEDTHRWAERKALLESLA